MNFDDIIKGKLVITHNIPDQPTLLYKIYLLVDKTKYLIESDVKNFKSEMKFSIKTQFSFQIPPGDLLSAYVELFPISPSNVRTSIKPLSVFTSDPVDIHYSNLRKYFKLLGVDVPSTIILPNQSLVFWVRYALKKYPLQNTLSINASLTSKDTKIAAQSYSIKIIEGKANIRTETLALDLDANSEETGVVSIPFSIKIPDFSEPNFSAVLSIEILNDEEVIAQKSLDLKASSGLKGFFVKNIKYDDSVSIGNPAYMIADIQNKSNSNVKGKAGLSFYSPSLGKIPCFKRKFKIRSGGYELLNEDIYFPEYLAGIDYWVLGEFSIKSNLGSLFLQDLSSPLFTKIPSSPIFVAKIFAHLPLDIQKGEIISVGVDVRVRSREKIKNLECIIIQTRENSAPKAVHKFKVKNMEITHNSFHWKVPPQFGQYKLAAKFKIDHFPIQDANIELDPILINYFPKSKISN